MLQMNVTLWVLAIHIDAHREKPINVLGDGFLVLACADTFDDGGPMNQITMLMMTMQHSNDDVHDEVNERAWPVAPSGDGMIKWVCVSVSVKYFKL